jgi:Flp pilus assembly protein TadB
MKNIKKTLAYVACWLLILLAFAALVGLVGAGLIAVLFIEFEMEARYQRKLAQQTLAREQEQAVAEAEALLSGGR